MSAATAEISLDQQRAWDRLMRWLMAPDEMADQCNEDAPDSAGEAESAAQFAG